MGAELTSYSLHNFELRVLREDTEAMRTLAERGLTALQIRFIEEPDPARRREMVRQGEAAKLGATSEEKQLINKVLRMSLERRYPKQPYTHCNAGDPENALPILAVKRLSAKHAECESEIWSRIAIAQLDKNRKNADAVSKAEIEGKAQLARTMVLSRATEFSMIGTPADELDWILQEDIEGYEASGELPRAFVYSIRHAALAQMTRLQSELVGIEASAERAPNPGATGIRDSEIYNHAGLSKETYYKWSRGEKVAPNSKTKIEQANVHFGLPRNHGRRSSR